jgi:2-dehydropantoate 2-reductase
MTKICIVGLGAIGGLAAAWLARLGAEVELSALARGATLDAVRRNGLRCEDASGSRTVPLRAAERADALGPQDLIVLAVKAPALPAVAPAVKALSAPHTRVLCAMNGVPWWFFQGLPGRAAGLRLASADPTGTLDALIPASCVIGGVVHLSATTPAPGVVRHVSGTGLIIGKPGGGRDAEVQALAALLGRAGFAPTVSERIQRDIWFKLWGNMTMNPVSALTGATADRVLADELVVGFVSAVMLEAQAIGAAIGIPIDQAPAQRHEVTRKLGAFKTSMLQDVEAGRPLELDALVGTVREIGRHLGLATPNIDALFGLARLMARQRGLYPAG